MKLENIKNKIDTYFDNITPEDLCEKLKKYGVKIINIKKGKGKSAQLPVKLTQRSPSPFLTTSIAEWLKQLTLNQQIQGSSPCGGTKVRVLSKSGDC